VNLSFSSSLFFFLICLVSSGDDLVTFGARRSSSRCLHAIFLSSCQAIPFSLFPDGHLCAVRLFDEMVDDFFTLSFLVAVQCAGPGDPYMVAPFATSF